MWNMWPSGLHIPVVVYYAYEHPHLFCIIRWFHIYYVFSKTGRIPVRFTQNRRYAISVCPKDDFSLLSIRKFSLSFWKWLFHFLQVIAPITFFDCQMVIDVCLDKFKPRNISLIFSCRISQELVTPLVGACTGIFPTEELLYMGY